jgi:hypothetical protein
VTPVQRWLAWGSSAAVAGTGLVQAWMLWLVSPADPMDLVNHPWQPTVRELHVLAGPLWLVVFGALWQGHAAAKLRAGAPVRRRSGLAVIVLAAPMAASGYLLQVAVDDVWRTLWCVVHVGSSLAWIAGFVLHGIPRRRAVPGPEPAATNCRASRPARCW